MPRDLELVNLLADRHAARGRTAEAVKALLEARARRRDRPAAIALLQRALVLQPGHVDATLDLAKVLAPRGARRPRPAPCSRRWYEGASGRKLRAPAGGAAQRRALPCRALALAARAL
jgi:hypothetical protein